MADDISGRAKLNVVVSADIDLSYQQIIKDLTEITKRLATAKLPSVSVNVDYASTEKNFQTQLQDISNKLKLNVTVTPTVSASDNSSLPPAQVSTRKMSQATAELVKQKKATLELLGAEQIRHSKEMNAHQERTAKDKAELAALRTRTAAEKAANAAGTTNRRIEYIQNQVKSIDLYTQKLNALQATYQKLGAVPPGFKDIRDSITEISSMTVDATNYEEVAKKLKNIDTQYKAAAQAAQTFAKESSRDISFAQNEKAINSLKMQLEGLFNASPKLRANTEAMREYSSIMSELTSGNQISPKRIIQLKTQVDGLTSSWKQSGLLAQTFGDKIKAAYEKFGGWMLITRSLTAVIRMFKQMIQNVSELDKAMTELKKVTSETEATYDSYIHTAIASSKELGATLVDVVTATADYARLGYSIVDATSLAEASILYKNVGDGIESISDASESIISTMKAFGIEAEDASGIVDRFNEVGNNFAISSKGIGDALLRSASSLSAAGNTIDESIGMIVAMNNVLQDPESVGTSLKTISMRLRNTAGKLEELGEDAEGAAESVTKLQTQLLNLTSGKVNIMADTETFKSTYQIVTELSEVWNELSDKAQADITRLVAGTRQGNAFSALMNNMADGADAVAVSLDSAGSAMAENEKYMDSIAGKTAKFTAAFQELSTNLINSQIIKGIVDIGTGALNLLNILGKIHALLPLLVAIIVAIRSYSIAKNISNLTAAMVIQKGVTDQMITSVVALSAGEKKLLLDQINRAIMSKQLTSTQADQIISTLGLVTAEGALATANKATAVSFKTLMASIPVWGQIALAITVVIEAVSYLTSALAKNKQELIDNSKALIDNYNNATESYKSNTASLNDLKGEFDKLSEGVDENGKNVSLTADEYERYRSIINQIIQLSPDVCKGYDNEGNAIVAYKSLIDDAISSQETLMKNQRNIYIGGGKDIFEGKKKEYEDQLSEGYDTMVSMVVGVDNLWETLSDVDKHKSKLQELWNIFEQFDIHGIDVENGDVWYDSLEEWIKIYENYEGIITLIRNSNIFEKDEIDTLEAQIRSLAGSYTQSISIIREQVNYLSEWSKDQNWYDSIPTDALDEFTDGLTEVNDPLVDFNTNVQAAEKFGSGFAKALSSDSVVNIISLSKGLKDGTVSLEEYNNAVKEFNNSFTGSEDVQSSITSYLNSLSNVVTVASDSGSAINEITAEIDNYNRKIKLLNQLFAEQETNGEISAETYDYIKNNCTELTGVIEAQYDVLGNFKSWKINATEATKYADAQKELTLEVLNSTTATAKQIATLYTYQGSTDSTSKKVKEICEGISELTDAYIKATNEEQFSLEETEKLKASYPGLKFEFIETTDTLGNVTTGYKLNRETVVDLITDNYDLLASVADLRLEYIKLKTTMELMTTQGRNQANSQQYINVITNKIIEDGITSFEEYAKAIGVNEDEIADWIKTFVTLYTDGLKDVEKAKEEYDAEAGVFADGSTLLNKDDKKEDLWKDAFEKKQSELEYQRDRDIISEAEYYEKLKSLNEEYFGEKHRATITDTKKKAEYLELWRKYDLEYYESLKKAEDKWKAEFDKKQSELEHQKDKDVISEAEYYEKLKSLSEEYFGEKHRATIIDTEEKAECLELWRKYDVEYYDFLKKAQDKYIETSEKQYKIHQNEKKYIEDLTWALNEYGNALSDTQRENIITEIEKAQSNYYDNLITDIEHEISLLERESDTEQSRIELYEKAQKILLDKKQYYADQGYDVTSDELQSIENEYNEFADDIVDIMESAFDKMVESQKDSYEQMISQIESAEDSIDTVLDAVVNYIKRKKQEEIDALNNQLDQTKASYDDATKVTEDYYDGLIDQANDSYDAQQEACEEYFDNLIDETKDSYDAQREAQEQYYDDIIDKANNSYDTQREAQEQYYDNLAKSIEDSRDLQVEALEDMISAYEDLINLKKESLQASRDIEKYNDEVASKNKNISSIQSRIDALQFDDSDSARAKRLQLEEELVEAEKDLDDYQKDYALDNQLDALDEELDAYKAMMEEKIELIQAETDVRAEEYEKQKEAALEALEVQNEAYIESLEKEKEAILEMLETQNEAHIASLEMQKESELKALESQNELYIASLEAKKEATLKSQEEVYNAQVAVLEAQISDIEEYLEKEGNLRRDANELLKKEGQQLWDELMAYEYEYSEDISDLQEAWNIAKGAMNEYNNGQLDALQTLSTMVSMLKEYNQQLDILNNMSYSDLSDEMKSNSSLWDSSTGEERSNLHQKNVELAQKYNESLGTNALQYNDQTGKWYLNNVPLYHSGAENGFILQNKFPVPKSNEILAKLAAGELVVTPSQLSRVAKTMFNIGASTPAVQSSQLSFEKMIDVHVGNINEASLKDFGELIDKSANEAIRRLNDGLRLKGVRSPAIKNSY